MLYCDSCGRSNSSTDREGGSLCKILAWLNRCCKTSVGDAKVDVAAGYVHDYIMECVLESHHHSVMEIIDRVVVTYLFYDYGYMQCVYKERK